MVWAQGYDPFGRVVAELGPDARFAGHWFAAENGLHQNWMRDYDATFGRYIQADPLGLVDGASVYRYVGGNPAMFSDPTGQCPFCVAALVIAGVMLTPDSANAPGMCDELVPRDPYAPYINGVAMG